MHRFRVNASLGCYKNELIIQVSLRVMSTYPPAFSTLNVPLGLQALSHIKEGIIVVCGATGSGKSTLLASMLAARANESKYGEKILTYESPIEYLLPMNVNRSIVAQTELPRCLPDYAYAVRNALRRTPTAIMVGEARDTETISAVIEASLTGHAVYTTLHSQSVSEAVSRLLMLFPSHKRQSVRYDFFTNVKAIIWQKLLPSTDGKRVALREYLLFDKALQRSLAHKAHDSGDDIAHELVRQGTSKHHHLEQLFNEGLITSGVYQEYLDE